MRRRQKLKLPVKKLTDLGKLWADDATLKLEGEAISSLETQEIGGS